MKTHVIRIHARTHVRGEKEGGDMKGPVFVHTSAKKILLSLHYGDARTEISQMSLT